MRTTKNNKVTYKLACDKNYAYYRKSSKAGGTAYWRCSDRSVKCNATIISRGTPEQFFSGQGWDEEGFHEKHKPDVNRYTIQTNGKFDEECSSISLRPSQRNWLILHQRHEQIVSGVVLKKFLQFYRTKKELAQGEARRNKLPIAPIHQGGDVLEESG